MRNSISAIDLKPRLEAKIRMVERARLASKHKGTKRALYQRQDVLEHMLNHINEQIRLEREYFEFYGGKNHD
jgi:hypothetical protein